MRLAVSLLLCSLALASCNKEPAKPVRTESKIACNGLKICDQAVRELSAAERSMNDAFGFANERLKNCKPVNSTRCYNMPRAIELVAAEQKTWLAWRNAHCDVFTFGMEETSAEGELRAACRMELTLKRTAELKKVRDQ